MAGKILDRIECEKIKTRSKWYFVFKNDLFWGIGLLSVAIGSISIAASIFAFSYAEIDLYSATHDSLVAFLYDTLPIMWVLSLVIFIALGCYQIRNTRRGYRYSLVIIVGGSLVLSFGGGFTLHAMGFGELLEKAIGNHIPFHNSIDVDKRQIWVNAGRGVIAGEVVKVNTVSISGNSFIIKDFSGRPWIVLSEELSPRDLSVITTEQTIKIVGLPAMVAMGDKATSTMFGCFVFAWEPGKTIVIDQKVSANNNLNNLSERNSAGDRSSKCKDIRPYQLLQRLRAESI